MLQFPYQIKLLGRLDLLACSWEDHINAFRKTPLGTGSTKGVSATAGFRLEPEGQRQASIALNKGLLQNSPLLMLYSKDAFTASKFEQRWKVMRHLFICFSA